MIPARWAIWWTPGGLVVDPSTVNGDPAPPVTVVEGFIVLVPTSPGDPDGSGVLCNALVALAPAAEHGPDRLGAALADGFHGLRLEAVFQPDESKKQVAP